MITTHNVAMPIREWTLVELIKLCDLTSGKAADWDKASLKKIKDELRVELLIYQNYSCAYCKREITNEIGRSELDHIVPCSIAPMFTFVRANLTLTCKRCNHSKKDFNPTTLSDDELRAVTSYICDHDKYIWIHPFIHRYEDHINIIDGAIFESVNESKKGLAVISKCKLDEIGQVVDIHKAAKIMRAKTPLQAMLMILGEYPDEPSDRLAANLHNKFPEISFRVFVEKIEKIRGDNPFDAFNLG